MANLFSTTFKIRAASGANGLLYFISRLPLVGRLLPSRIFAAGRAKTIVSIVFTVGRELFGIFTKALYLFGVILLPAELIKYETVFEHFGGLFPEMAHILFWMSCFIPLFTDSVTLKATKDKFICIRHMRADPRRYMLATVPFTLGVFFVQFLPALVLCSVLAGGGLPGALVLWLMLASFRLAGEAFQLWWFKHFHFSLFRKMLPAWGGIILGLLAAYLPIALGWPLLPVGFLFSLPGVAAMALLLGLCIWYVFWGYGSWRPAILRNLKLEYVAANTAQANKAAFRDVEMKEEDLAATPQQSARIRHMKGYAYFNALFFSRHRRLLFRPMLIRLAITGTLFAAFAAAVLAFPDVAGPLARKIPDYLPLVVFVMYFTSMAAKACRAMFYNCDNSMLRYAFYRKADVVVKNFNIRLRYVAGYNLLVGLAICLSVLGVTLLAGGSVFTASMGAFCLSVLLLSVFFSVHHLFLYYLFQPYTTDLSVKNPFYNIINMAVYMASFACFQIRTAGMAFAFVVLGVTVLYIAVALVLVYRFSPKYFRVK